MNMLKKLFAPVDMTVGKPWEDILLFTVPMLIGNIAQQLYNTVDSVVVGNYVGDIAVIPFLVQVNLLLPNDFSNSLNV